MKKLMAFLLIASSLVLIWSNGYAVEHIVTYPDKSQLFRCEMHGSVFKVHVKMVEYGKYRVVVIGKGVSGNSGFIYAENFVAAARWGCGGEE